MNKITKEIAQAEYDKLAINKKPVVEWIGQDIRRRYMMSGITVDLPYFFFSLYPGMFNADEKEPFLEITNVDDFVNNIIFVISRHLNKGQKQWERGKNP